MGPGREFEVGDYVDTPQGRGLLTHVEPSGYVNVGLSGGGNYFGHTWNLTLIKAVG